MRKLTLACLVHVSVWAWAQDAAPAPAPAAPPAQIKLKATVAAPPGPDGKPGDVLAVPQVVVASGAEGKVSVSGPPKPALPGQPPVPPAQLELSFHPTLLPTG